MNAAREMAAVAARNLRYAGLDAIRELVWRTVYSVRSGADADPVLDADWDVLVVLDACRADLFESVVEDGDYERIPVGSSRTSPASSSEEWLESVFGDATDEALAGLAYVTGNPFSAVVVDETRFGELDDVWQYAWDESLGTIPPEPITDSAIDIWRNRDVDRMVVHYMQPHFPSLVDQVDDGVALEEFGDRPLSVWENMRFGHRDVDDVWKRYRANFQSVLEEVESLLTNLDADRVVLTADHGNAFGEKHIYGHPGGVHLPCLRDVPWSVTSGIDTHSRDGWSNRDDERSDGANSDDDRSDNDRADDEKSDEGRSDDEPSEELVEDRLENLGYKT